MLGRALIFLAAFLAAYSGFAALSRDDGVQTSSRRAIAAAFGAVLAAMVVLWVALFRRDFSYEFVAGHTTTAAGALYTFTALWGGQEGSLLLWCAMASGWGALVARRRAGVALSVVAFTSAFFLFMNALAANPFARADIVAAQGRGLNPLLFSWGMAIHPPLLYLGFTGTAVVFGMALWGLVTRRPWVREARPYAIGAWLVLGAGLVVGGAWAYTELGWGGIWGWDPVENAALAPWLVLTAYIHSAQVEERRGLLRTWNASLAALAFCAAVLGTFLTRSGSLYSVHSFAQSPVGWWFLAFLVAALVVSAVAIGMRSSELRSSGRIDAAISRESLFVLNNVLLVGSAAAVLIASDVIPAVTEAFGGRRVLLGAPFFNSTISVLLAALVAVAAVGVVVPWRRALPGRLAARLAPSLAAGALAGTAAGLAGPSVAFGVAVSVAAFAVAVHVQAIVRDARVRNRSLAGLFAANRRRYGGYVVHIGLAITLLGFAGSLLKTQRDATLRPGQTVTFAGHRVTFEGLRFLQLPDREVIRAEMRAGSRSFAPQVNIHPGWEKQPRSRVGIVSGLGGDLYVFLRSWEQDGSVSVTLHDNPLQMWLWAGVSVAGAGGLVCLSPERRRRHQASQVEKVSA